VAMLTISKEFIFDAAHRLYREDLPFDKNREIFGKCCRFHGHTWRLHVTVCGQVDRHGLILHFADLKKIVTTTIIDRYDHANLNELAEFRYQLPTAENMVRHIFRQLEEPLRVHDVKLKVVTLYETPTAWATMTHDA
jgi:6-pyruvoyltetrahydropterin/6-carboxytetrahydropterin synthase